MVILQVASQPFNPSPAPVQRCCYCSSEALHRWGARQRQIKDRTTSQATVQRYRCKACRRTFTAHPLHLGRSPQTRPYQATLLTLYLLGLSLRAVPQVLSLLGVTEVSFMTVWRDLQRWGQKLRHPALKTRIVGVDTTFVSVKGKKQGILLAVDLAGKMVLLQAVGTEAQYQQAFSTLRDSGVEVVVTDDDHAFHGPVESLGLQQQGCVWHAGRVIGRAFRKLSSQEREQWQEVISLIKDTLHQLPPHPPPELWRAQTLPLPSTLRYALVYLLNLWSRLTLYQKVPSLPITNNITERAIGKSKMRARVVRGFKSRDGALNFFALTQLPVA
jgi:transposase-like protein